MENRIIFSLLALALLAGFAFAISGSAAAPFVPAPDRWNGEAAAASAAASGGTPGSSGWALLQPANLPPSFYGYLEVAGNSGQESSGAFSDNVYYFYAKLL